MEGSVRTRAIAVTCAVVLLIGVWGCGGKSTTSGGNITTVAGSVNSGAAGDGSAATSAQLNGPTAVAADSQGNFYIADSGNNKIRKVTASSGVISTIAGTGAPGFAGDGGAATSALLNAPRGVAVDSNGNVYIADTGNARVRKVSSSGVITTYAGSGTPGFAGDGGPAVNAQFAGIQGLAVDSSGNLYIADRFNSRVRVVTASSGVITTVAGNGTAGFGGDGSNATSAQLNVPAGVAVDSSGTLYIADQENHRVRKVSGGTITTIAGTGTAGALGDGGAATSAELNGPQSVAVDGGNIFIADSTNNRVRKIASDGKITTQAGTKTAGFSGDGASATAAQMFTPAGVATVSGGILIADTGNNRIRKVTF